MKKRILLLLLIAVTVLALPLSVSAATLLSGGIGVMAEEAGMIKGAVAGDTVRFSATDFKQAMGIRRFDGITLTSLPDGESGTLYFGKEAVSVGVTVPRASLDNLTFVPKDEGVKEAAFRFTCESYAGGAEIACTIRFAESLNRAPTVSELSAMRAVSTYRGMMAEGCLLANDPEGDPLEFIVIGYPAHGALTLTDSASGDFRYTPVSGFIGKDEFSFVVRDIYGNYSAPATVHVSVCERESTLDYCDLPITSACLPALVLAEENIMLGTLVGDGMYFSPDEGVSRGEFLVMAMKAAGITPRAGLVNTVFDDNEAISEGIRPYAATAQECGYIIGKLTEDGLMLAANEEITRGEAALITSRILGASLPTSGFAATDEAMPSAYRDGALSLLAAGIYPKDAEGLLSVSDRLDRAAAAEMLYGVLLMTR